MKVVKFRKELVPLILSGQKTSTWRLFDDKDLRVGDKLDLRVFVTLELFAKAEITEVIEKPLKEFTVQDKAGHEDYENDNEMYQVYSDYYKQQVGPETLAKIIRFKLIK